MRFNHASESFKKLNPHLFGGVESNESKQDATRALDNAGQKRKASAKSVEQRPRVTLVSFRKRLLDGDNLQGGFKPLRDAVANSLGIDDSDSNIDWEYQQVISKGKPCVCVKVEL